MSLIFGDKVETCAQMAIGSAWKKNTPQAFRHAIAMLQGMRLLVMAVDGSAGNSDVLALNNKIDQAIEMLAKLESA